MASNTERPDQSEHEVQVRKRQQGVVIPEEVGHLEGKYATLLRWRDDESSSEAARSERNRVVSTMLELDDVELREKIADVCQLDRQAANSGDWRSLSAVLLSLALSTNHSNLRKLVSTPESMKPKRARGRPKEFGESWVLEVLDLVDSAKWDSARMFGPHAMSDAKAAEKVAVLKLGMEGKRTVGRERESLTKRIRDELPYARRLRLQKFLSGFLSRNEPFTPENLRPYNWFSSDEELAAMAEQYNAANPAHRLELARMLADVERELNGKSNRRLKKSR